NPGPSKAATSTTPPSTASSTAHHGRDCEFGTFTGTGLATAWPPVISLRGTALARLGTVVGVATPVAGGGLPSPTATLGVGSATTHPSPATGISTHVQACRLVTW